MAQVELHINGRPYKVACGDGEEARTTALAADVDRRISDLKRQIGNVGDARLLVLASILMADELAEARANAGSRANAEEPVQQSLPTSQDTSPSQNAPSVSDSGETAALVNRLADRIERIAEKLEAA